ncbi:MAG: hypothetical protein APR63_13620 [Desulfuromonas sp. SDB]|nr:MAG: hypothetical protein APR63_13620 [Desulfuromonas sp. SDB]
MKIISTISFLIIYIFFSCGCAALTKGDNFIAINSHPPRTAFTIRNTDNEVIVVDTTPSQVDLFSRSHYYDEDFTITFEKEGYQSKTVDIDAKVHFWHHWRSSGDQGFYNGWHDDIFSGPTWIYPEEVFVKLKKFGIKMSTWDNEQ